METNNSITKFYSSVDSIDALDAALAKGQINRPSNNSGTTSYLRMSQEGDGFTYGVDNTPIEENSRWSINPVSFKRGYANWATPSMNNGKREKLGEVMVPITDQSGPPDIDHSTKGGSWQEQFGFDLVCLDGEDAGEKVQFIASSHGGKSAFDNVYQAVVNRPDKEHCFPVVILGFSSYKNKNWNKTIYVPEFEVKDWSDMENHMLSAGKSSEAATLPVNAPENDNEETPRRRRRAV